MPRLPLIEDFTKGPIPPGSNILVEFDPASQWYNACLTIATGWVQSGGVARYSVITQPPDKVRSKFRRLGMDPSELEQKSKLVIYDYYAASLGQQSKENHPIPSLNIADLSIQVARSIRQFPLGHEDLRLHEKYSVISRFNDEKTWVDFVLNRPMARTHVSGSSMVLGVMAGFHSDRAYKALEVGASGVIDFKLDETGEVVTNLIRITKMENVGFDSRWHALKIGENFEVTLEK